MSVVPSWTKDRDEVRLFPSVHIHGEKEAELRAAASLLAAIRAVSEFGRKIVGLSDGIASKTSRFSCYTEVTYKLRVKGKKPKTLRPDGVIVVTRGKSKWVAFVEFKVGKSTLVPEKIDDYQRLASQERVDALITVSNQAAHADDSPPVNINWRRNLTVRHFSWERLLSEALHLSEQKAISDPDQKWILDEWIRYVDDDASGIVVPPDLGSRWNEVLKAAQENRLEKSEADLRDVAQYWIGFLRKAAFRLRAKLGVDVEVRMTREERRDTSIQAEKSANTHEGTLTGTFRIPDAAGDIKIEVDLRSRVVRYAMTVAAPTEGLQKTRIRWVYKHLRSEEDLPGGDLKVIVAWNIRSLTTEAQLSNYLNDPSVLCKDNDDNPVSRKLQPRSFTVVWTRNLSQGRARASTNILEGISQGLDNYYDKITQNIKPFVRKPPRLATTKPEDARPTARSGEPDSDRLTPTDVGQESLETE